MKTSIEALPQDTQREIDTLTELITQTISECRMVILFGCYACGNYVILEERFNSELPEFYQSDYDMLVVTDGADTNRAADSLREEVTKKYTEQFNRKRNLTPVEFIVEDIGNLNEKLGNGSYFHTSVIQNGILLYNSHQVKLAEPHSLSFKKIRERASEYYDTLFAEACRLVGKAEDENNNIVTLNKACRQFYHTIFSVFTLLQPDESGLSRLRRMVKRYSRELSYVFPLRTEFETRCFDLLDKADDPDRPTATKEEIAYMKARTHALEELTECICMDRLTYYEEMS